MRIIYYLEDLVIEEVVRKGLPGCNSLFSIHKKRGLILDDKQYLYKSELEDYHKATKEQKQLLKIFSRLI